MQVQCNAITHSYTAGTRALNDVTLAFPQGATGLVGVNGAGKSTLLRILSGGLRPTRGDVTVLGAHLFGKGRRAALATTALMPQDFTAPRDVTVLDLVSYIGWLRGLSPGGVRATSDAVLEAVGLAEHRSAKVSTLSGGMVRRLALAQALVAQPALLLLDEPTTGLDPEQRVAVRQLIAALPEDRTTIISSHVMEDIESLATDVVVLDQGEAVFHGPVSQFVATYADAGSAEQAFLSMLLRRRAQ
jgi:ABC-2 type transport system ATP-binding protein